MFIPCSSNCLRNDSQYGMDGIDDQKNQHIPVAHVGDLPLVKPAGFNHHW